MSHHQIAEARSRLHRSELAVPGSRPELFEKAAASRADYVFLDLEDAVAPDEKEAARRNVIEALGDIDWRGARKTVSVRINGLDTHYMYRDLIDVVEQAGAHLDTILIPKVGVPGDVYTVDALLTQLERALGLSHRIGVEALVETAPGDGQCRGGGGVEPAAGGAALRGGGLRGVVPGPDDHHRRAKSRLSGDQWHSALSRMLVACRANGRRAIDGPFGDFGDPEGFTAGARRAAALGYDGKPSTPHRSIWPMRCSHHRSPRWTRAPGAAGTGGGGRGRAGRRSARRAHDRCRVGAHGSKRGRDGQHHR